MLFRAWKKIALLIAWFISTGCAGRFSNDISDNTTRPNFEDSPVYDSINQNVTKNSVSLPLITVRNASTSAFTTEETTTTVDESRNEDAIADAKTLVNGSEVNDGSFPNADSEVSDQAKMTTTANNVEEDIKFGDNFVDTETEIHSPLDVDQGVTEGALLSHLTEDNQKKDNINGDDILPAEITESQPKENEIKEKMNQFSEHINFTSTFTTVIVNNTTRSNNDISFISSPVVFTRAYQFQSVGDINEDFESVHLSSRSFVPLVLPYGSRFQARQSSNIPSYSFADKVTPSWHQSVWPPLFTPNWDSRIRVDNTYSISTCSIHTCDYRSILNDLTSPFPSHLLVNPLSSSLFPQTNEDLSENDYKSDEYFDPIFQSFDILKSNSRILIHVPHDEKLLSVSTSMPIYTSSDGLFGIRITESSHPLLETSRTSFSLYKTKSQTDRRGLTTPVLNIVPEHTGAIELQRNVKESDSHGTNFPSSMSGGHPQNEHLNVENTETAFLKSVKINEEKIDVTSEKDPNSQGFHLSSSFSGFPLTSHQSTNYICTNTSSTSVFLQQTSSNIHPNMTLHSSLISVFSSDQIFASTDITSSFMEVSQKMISSPFTHSVDSHENLILKPDNPEHSIMPDVSHVNRQSSYQKDLDHTLPFDDVIYEKNVILNSKEKKQPKYEVHDEPKVNHSSSLRTNTSEFDSSQDASNTNLFFSESRDFARFQEIPQGISFTSYLPDEIAPTMTFNTWLSTQRETVSLTDDERSSKLLSSFYEILTSGNDFISPLSFSKTPYLLDSQLSSHDLVSPLMKTSENFIRTAEILPPYSHVNETEVLHGTKDDEIHNDILVSSTNLHEQTIVNMNTFKTQESSIFHYVSSSYPHLMSLLVERNKTRESGYEKPLVLDPLSSTSVTISYGTREEKDYSSYEQSVPPPRITNPNCSTLPICIAITIGMSWTEFCLNVDNFRSFLADSLSQYTRPIHPNQIILSSDHHECKTSGKDENNDLKVLRKRRNASTIVISIYFTNKDGEYDNKLTEICGVILKIWMPTSGTPFQNRVMEVKLFHVEEDPVVPKSIPSEPPTSTGIIAVITISTVAGACLVLLCILLVVMKQRLLQNRNCNPALDAYSLDSFSINASFRRRRIRQSMRSFLNHAFDDPELPSHLLSESGLMNSLRNIEALEEEFKKLPMNMPKLDQIPNGAEVKNRYANVFPNPDTRVPLSAPEGDPIKEYINANYVKGYDGKLRAYIATQAPLPETVEDFWKMIWEQQSRVILMITMLEENGMQRCAAYFPESTLDCHKLYGDYQVSLQKKDIREFYTMSTFRLYNLEVKKNLFREVVHFWFTAWPTSGVPSDPGSLVTFLLQARPYIKCNSGPTVVHCSPGTGRSGVILALDMSMREYEESRSVDFLRCLARIRRDRGGAVQNKEQYVLLHEALAEYVSNIVNQSHRPSIRSNS